MIVRTGKFNIAVPNNVVAITEGDGYSVEWRTGTEEEMVTSLQYQLINVAVIDDVTGSMSQDTLVDIIFKAKELLRRSGINDEEINNMLVQQEELVGNFTNNTFIVSIKEDLAKNPCTENTTIFSDDPDQFMQIYHKDDGLELIIYNDFVDHDEDGGPYSILFDKEWLGQLSNFIKEVKNGNKPENLKFNVEFKNKTLILNVKLNLDYDPSTKYIDFLLDATDCYCDVEFGDDLDKLEKYIMVALERLA